MLVSHRELRLGKHVWRELIVSAGGILVSKMGSRIAADAEATERNTAADWFGAQSEFHALLGLTLTARLRAKTLTAVRCRPDLRTSASFQLIFERFAFEHSQWVRHTRVEPGCWEYDDSLSFPPSARFP
jgi:hypothetical protein